MTRLYPPDVCDLNEIAYLTGVSPGTFETYVANNLLPRPIKLGGKRLWIRSHVVEAIADRARRDAAAGSESDIVRAARGKTKAA